MKHGGDSYKVSPLSFVLMLDLKRSSNNELNIDAQIRVSAEEVEQTDHHTSVALADGSGYVAELGVYHWLHCLVLFTVYHDTSCTSSELSLEQKKIKQYMHLDHYHPEWNDHMRARQKLHIGKRYSMICFSSILTCRSALYRVLA